MDQVKISFYAPKSLRTELNVIAAKQDRTVTSILTELVEDFVRENKWVFFFYFFTPKTFSNLFILA